MNNKNIVSMRKKIEEYKAVIFDVDGTLYSQPKLRLFMAVYLTFHYACHPLHIRELFLLKRYRKIREQWQDSHSDYAGSSSLEEAQYQYAAQQMHISAEQVRRIISYWIHIKPLSLLPKCKDKELIKVISQLRSSSITVAVYSDYPAKDKLEAINIAVDYVFCSTDSDINCMKPDPKAMECILKKLNISRDHALMIGDRYSKDGLAAENIGMDYIILSKSLHLRSELYQNLFQPS